MRLLRGLLGALLWVLATVVGLVAVLLCATVLLLPLGIPLLMYARKLFVTGGQLMLPRALAHPVDELQRSTRTQGRRAEKSVEKTAAKGKKLRSRRT